MAALDDGWRLHDEHEAGQHARPVDGCGRCFRGLVAERDLARDASRTNMETMREMVVRLGRAEAERDALKAEVTKLRADNAKLAEIAWNLWGANCDEHCSGRPQAPGEGIHYGACPGYSAELEPLAPYQP